MKVSLFDFELPKELIALRPAPNRDGARLLLVKGHERQNHHVTNLAQFLNSGDVLVFNDTRVIPARLSGKRGLAKIEVTLHMNCDNGLWKAFARPAKKLRTHDVIVFSETFEANVIEKGEAGEISLQFNCKGQDLSDALHKHGVMPLPPYIASQRPVDAKDLEDYQTIYSKREGAVAAPTAGLHFSNTLLEDLFSKGIEFAHVTLHVGAGTFLPVKVNDTQDHRMHAEWGEIDEQTAKIINDCHKRGNNVIAIGTTSLRLLESASDEQGITHPFSGSTDIFITPGYKFRTVDILMTNFHLPKSTLFMLVSAFAGYDAMKSAYAYAIEEKYRFYSYGDSSLLFREDKL
ncbi:MAG: tRNA preQ1(34) S-adenosylmethionine ribosyltransferase-isomerase QueA [Emcibacter sp.]|nr:tRNA preQ1(34) S-adenosylmethionine ribosyltransferase-isomerase QueA [Emcibacter sp.]